MHFVWCGRQEQVSVSQRHIPEKKIKKQAGMVLPVSPKVGLGYNCPMLNVYDVIPRVRRINRTNLRNKNREDATFVEQAALRPAKALLTLQRTSHLNQRFREF